MKQRGQLHAAADLPPTKNLQYLLKGRLVGPTDYLEVPRTHFAPARIRIPKRQFLRLVTKLTVVSWLNNNMKKVKVLPITGY
jgi:hypothetical protein